MMLITKSLFIIAGIAQTYAATITISGFAPQFSPVFPNLAAATGVVTSYNPGPYDISTSLSTTGLSGFPPTWVTPPTDSAEVQAAYNAIDWSQVPNAPIRTQNSDGSWNFGSDSSADPFCWWSYDNCVKPKFSYLPEDYYTCPNAGDWGLTYDDGPFNRYTGEYADLENAYAEPILYNFLTETNQKATLFYIGSNVATYPAAAKRGLNDGHHICVHTWSHPPMTTKNNAEVVAELYWTAKVIKTATGITPKCWRPPQGDVDDRVRAIAWQMGMRTVLWDHDSNDWDMPAPNGGDLSPSVVDSYFQGWINDYTSGKDKAGHIVLEHELNSMTVNMSMFWMSKIQNVFNVIPALACNGVTEPYWETDFVYPLSNSRPSGSSATTTTKTTTTGTKTTTTGTKTTTTGTKTTTTGTKTTTTGTKTTTTGTKTTTSGTKTTTTSAATSIATCVSGSSDLGNGDGYNGYCCTTSDDCWDTCVSGICNGPTNTQTTTTAKTTVTTKTTTTKTITETTTKTTTSKASTTTSGSCTAGSSGKKNGDGNTGACCTSSDDCVETCRSGVCGL